MTRLLQKRADDAADAVIAGVKAAPGSAIAQASAAWVLTYVGRPKEALSYYEQAKRIYVVPPWWLFGAETQAYMDIGDFEAALAAGRTLARFAPSGFDVNLYAWTAMAQMGAGNEAEARRAIDKAFELDPKLSIQALSLWDVPYVDPAIPERKYVLLRQLGVPDTHPWASRAGDTVVG